MPLAIGTRLGPYEITAALGAGGMGEVYKAVDRRLGRTVAVKVLSPALTADHSAQQRFEREGQVLAALSHPHICQLFDVGEHDGNWFLVMAYLEGETLHSRLSRGKLRPDLALAYAIQIADALAAAHRAGVVHRDLKPANIMLTAAGAQLLDFGLARSGVSAAAQGLSDTPTRPDLTGPWTVVGTAQYMAPEQLEGKPADPRTDIFAFGTVLYEMVTGTAAFSGTSRAGIVAAILEREPQALAEFQRLTSPALSRLVRKCLEKDPDKRWQTAHDLQGELAWIAQQQSDPHSGAPIPTPAPTRHLWRWLVAGCLVLAGAGAYVILPWGPFSRAPQSDSRRVRSIAILPFRNVGASREYDYFGLGLADVLMAKMTNARFLEVHAIPGSSRNERGDQDPLDTGRALHVDTLLAGSYQVEGGVLSLSYALTDVRGGVQIAGNAIQDSFTNAIAVEHRIASDIVDALRVSASPEDRDRITTSPTQENQAFQAYLRSNYEMDRLWRKPSAAQLKEVERFLDEALRLDPQFTLALVSRSRLLWIASFWGYATDPGDLDRAARDAEEAIRQSPELGEAYAARALVEGQRGDIERMRQSVRDALVRAPNSGLAYYAAGWYYMSRGLADQSVRAFGRARELTPDLVRRELGLAYRYQGDLTRAEHQLRDDLAEHPEDRVTAMALAVVLASRGDLAGSRKVQHSSLDSYPDDPNVQYLDALLAIREGKPFNLDGLLSRYRAIYWADAGYCANIAAVLALSGRRAEAVRWLERAGELGMKNYPFILHQPLYDSLRQDGAFQRYQESVRKQWEREVERERNNPLLPANSA
jgi:serine/threonine protein kinase/tetratricopeptide (TPR) repeat protein